MHQRQFGQLLDVVADPPFGLCQAIGNARFFVQSRPWLGACERYVMPDVCVRSWRIVISLLPDKRILFLSSPVCHLRAFELRNVLRDGIVSSSFPSS